MPDTPLNLESLGCNACGSDTSEPYLEQRDMRYTTTPRNLFRLVKCTRCSLIYLNPRPTADVIGVFYPDSFYADRPVKERERGAFGRLADRLDLSAHFKRSALREKQRVVKRGAPKTGRLLDVGCAAGEFIVSMRELGWTVEGVDISRDMCEHVSDQFGITCHNESINRLDLPPDSFDAITFWASMEHLYDPKGALRACHRALGERGVVVILVPNARSLEEVGLRNVDPNPVDIPRHLYHFSEDSLTALLASEGFEPLFVRHHTRNAADRFTVVMSAFFEKWLGSGNAPSRFLRIMAQNVALASGDLISRVLALAGRSHTFVMVARKAPRTAPSPA